MGRVISGLALAVVIAAAAGTAGFLIERSRVRSADQIRTATLNQATARQQYQAGRTQGRVEGRADGEQSGYNTGYDAGVQQTNSIVRRVSSNSFDAGYKAAFGGYDSPWVRGGWYIAHLTHGAGRRPLELASRIEMTSDQFYDMCPNGSGICGGSLAGLLGGGGSGGSGSGSGSPSIIPGLPNIPGLPSVPSPTYPTVCGDGTISPSGGHSGACSSHGGELLTP